MSAPAPLIVPALKRHTATVIVAHGLGDSGAGWTFLAENWRRRSKFEDVKFIFPNAPSIPITLVTDILDPIFERLLNKPQNGGMSMPGWYDIKGLDTIQQREDEPGINKSKDYFHSLIKQEIDAGIPSSRVVLGGFSQGGAMSLLSGLTAPTKLGGIFGLSCYLLLSTKIQSMIPKDSPNKWTSIFMGHGDADPVVKYQYGQMTKEKLEEWGWKIDFRTYEGMPHSACPEEIDDLEKWLRERVPVVDEGKDLSAL